MTTTWVTYDSTDVTREVDLLTLTKRATTSGGGGKTGVSASTGRRMYAARIVGSTLNTRIGLINTTASVTDYTAQTGKWTFVPSTRQVYSNGTNIKTLSGFTVVTGDTLLVVVDFTGASIYGYLYWYSTATATWTMLDGGLPIWTITTGTSLLPFVEFFTTASVGQVTADFLLDDMVYPTILGPYTRWEGTETVIGELTDTPDVWGVPGGAIQDDAVTTTSDGVGGLWAIEHEAVSDTSDGVDTPSNTLSAMSFVTSMSASTGTSAPMSSTNVAATDTTAGIETVTPINAPQMFVTSTADAATSMAYTIIQQFFESVAVSSGASVFSTINSANLYDAAVGDEVLVAAFEQVMADTIASTGVWNVTSAAVLADYLVATQTVSNRLTANIALAETLVALDAWNNASQETVAETITVTANHVAQVQALVALLETAQAVDVGTARVTAIQLVNDGFVATELTDFTGSTLNALIDDGVVVLVKVNIGGELFTGWVMNAETTAASEYQFADKQFNSACKHGTRYLMSAEDGIYAFTEDTTAESVMTYIKTGKMDFGSDLKKRIVNSYIVYSASGDMTLKVTTSEYGQLVTRDYRMVPPSDSETTDTRRVDIGRGIRSRYWQFEIVGDGVDCTIDEVGMLPVVLSRRF